MVLKYLGLSASGFVVAVLVACGGDDFQSDKPGTGGSAGAGGSGGSQLDGGGGAGATGGSGGGAGASGGSSGQSGAGGSAGGPPCTDTSCGGDEYCHDKSGECRKCTDPDEFEFLDPQPLATINAAHATKDVHAPRILDATAPALIYSVGTNVIDRALWATLDYNASVGAALLPPIDLPGTEATALPILAPADGPLAGYSLLFDNNPEGTLDLNLHGAPFDEINDVFKPPVMLPPPFNDQYADWSPAFAPLAQRAWWVSNRANIFAPKLYTASTKNGDPPVASVVPLSTFAPACPVNDGDLGPWATLDGSMLLFHGAEKFAGAGCDSGPNPKSDLYVAGLFPNGSASPAFPLSVNLQNTEDKWPSLSTDMCTLYFSSQRNGAAKLQLYSARRK